MPKVPALVNVASGTAQTVTDALRGDARVHLHEISAEALTALVAQQVKEEVDRLIVVGGDGTLASAAAVLVDKPTALAVIAGGTLNHFAKAHGIPVEPKAALDVALAGTTKQVDVGFVNDRLFLNTSSVGAYVAFVRRRQRLRWLGYYLASALAGLLTFIRLRSFEVELEVDGAVRRYQSPLVFIGVDERELLLPQLGDRKETGRRGLHVLIVRRTTRLGLLRMALRALFRRIRIWGRDKEVEILMVRECRIKVRGAAGLVALDGEIIIARVPFEYRLRPDALKVVVPR